MTKILITGGAGFIGSNLVKSYLKKGFEVAVLDDFSTGRREFCPEGIQIFEVDIVDGEAVGEVFQEFRPEIVSHHAAHVSVRVSLEKPEFDAEKNVLGSINVFQNAGKVGVKQVVFASTGGAMIPVDCEAFPLAEVEPRSLASPYALSKFTAENYLEFFAGRFGFVSTVFRYANVYGPRQTPKAEAGVIAIFIERLLRGEVPKIFGDGGQTRDFVFIDDLVKAHDLVLEKQISGVFNLGSATEISVLDLYGKIVEILGMQVQPEFGTSVEGELTRSLLDCSKFQGVSGWKPEVSLDEGLRRTAQWWRGRIS